MSEDYQIERKHGKYLLARRVIDDPQNKFFGGIAGYDVVGAFDTEEEAQREASRLGPVKSTIAKRGDLGRWMKLGPTF